MPTTAWLHKLPRFDSPGGLVEMQIKQWVRSLASDKLPAVEMAAAHLWTTFGKAVPYSPRWNTQLALKNAG